MNRVFKTRYFYRWMRKTELTDDALCAAVREMIQGLIDADLGGGVVKKRVGLAGRGKRGGARTLVATNKGNRWFFVFGFEKNERANISAEEKEALQALAQDLLSRTGKELDAEIEDGSLQEICHDRKD
ncbi:MAG TPA: hypothetical protein DFK12_14105 [Gallionellaceae bacterium]|nr:hypothetical protein [Gallionellaceae bacterium]